MLAGLQEEVARGQRELTGEREKIRGSEELLEKARGQATRLQKDVARLELEINGLRYTVSSREISLSKKEEGKEGRMGEKGHKGVGEVSERVMRELNAEQMRTLELKVLF